MHHSSMSHFGSAKILKNLVSSIVFIGVVGGFSAALIGSGQGWAAPSPSAAAILQKADDVRSPSQSYKLKVRVIPTDEPESEWEVLIKGKDKTLTTALKPAKDKGKKILMLEESMWLYLPKLKKSIRVSLNQKLTGQAANGDISRMRWAGDYKSKIEKEEDGAWVLFMEAEKEGLTYYKIRLWVDKKGYRPIKAEYLTKSAKVLKRAEFSDYREMAGAKRPGKTTIKDEASGQKTVLEILSQEPMEFPDTMFNQNNLK